MLVYLDNEIFLLQILRDLGLKTLHSSALLQPLLFGGMRLHVHKFLKLFSKERTNRKQQLQIDQKVVQSEILDILVHNIQLAAIQLNIHHLSLLILLQVLIRLPLGLVVQLAIKVSDLVRNLNKQVFPRINRISDVLLTELPGDLKLRQTRVHVEVGSHVVQLDLEVDGIWVFDVFDDLYGLVGAVLEEEVVGEDDVVVGGVVALLLEEVFEELEVGALELLVEDDSLVSGELVEAGVDDWVVLLDREVLEVLGVEFEEFHLEFLEVVLEGLGDGLEVSVVEGESPDLLVVDSLLFEDFDALFVEVGVFEQPVDVLEVEDLLVGDVVVPHEVEDVFLGAAVQDVRNVLQVSSDWPKKL